MRLVDRRTNALPQTDRLIDQRTQPVIEVLCRTYEQTKMGLGIGQCNSHCSISNRMVLNEEEWPNLTQFEGKYHMGLSK